MEKDGAWLGMMHDQTGTIYGGGDVWRGDVWWGSCMMRNMYGGSMYGGDDVWWG